MFTALVATAAAAFLGAAPFMLGPPRPVGTTVLATTSPGDSLPQPPHSGRGERLLPSGGEGPAAMPLRQVLVRGQPVRFGEGCLEAAPADGPSRPFVLKHTEVQASVTGFVSSVTVTQEFENPFSSPVEGVYVFPLPDDSAVDEMTLTAGARVIKARIHKREEARRLYEQAKSEGRRAALLDQERPNIFTQSVANLLPGETVKVTLHYVAPLKYDDGLFTFNFPMVVGPRYVPGAALAGQSQGTGTQPDTERVLDASRITPPAERSGRDVQVTLKLEAGSPIEALVSPSHQLLATRPSDHAAELTLAPADRVPNKDFIVRWRVAGSDKRAALLTTGGPGGTFALMVMPEAPREQSAPVPREMIFVIDTSCSMSGPPLAAAKRAMRSAIEQMNPDDTFMLIDFADRASSFHATPLPNLPGHVQRALSYLDGLPASGGTNQLDGLLRALKQPKDPSRLRMVLLMTDGFIGNEAEILSACESALGDARVFGFGIGSSVNHYLLARLSTVGRGFYQYVRPDEDPEPAVERFVRRIERPLLTDISIDWGGLGVFELMPPKVPDLFDSQPLAVVGRYLQPGRSTITITGNRNGRQERLQVTLAIPETAGSSPGLASLWARAKIEGLEKRQYAQEQAEIARQITTLGLEHHLVTAYTSLVALDDQRVTNAQGQTVAAPTLTPDLTEAGGGEHDGRVLTQRRFSTIQVIRGHAGPSTDGDDDFNSAFGAPASGTPAAKRMVFIPDAPGGGGHVPDTLGQSDIMEVVLANKPGIAKCIEEQRKKEPGKTGKLVMRWVILPSGKVGLVEVRSEEFRSTYVAGCIGGLIKSWTFPRHLTQGEPVVFPFKF